MLIDQSLAQDFWCEAVNHAALIMNNTILRRNTAQTAHELMFGGGTGYDLKRLKVFGTRCWVHVPDHGRSKFDPKSQRAIYL